MRTLLLRASFAVSPVATVPAATALGNAPPETSRRDKVPHLGSVMKRIEPVAPLFLASAPRVFGTVALGLVALGSTGCSGGGGGSSGSAKTGGDFVALRTVPTSGGSIFLNDPIAIDFSNEINLDSANLTTVAFQALDQLGNPTTEVVNGTFSLSRAAGDTSTGRRLQFVPRFATNNSYTNGGIQAGRTYLVSLVDGQAQNGTVLRDKNGKGLAAGYSFSFSTVDGGTPAQLYRNPKPGGPAFQGIDISTAPSLDQVPLNVFGAPPVEVRLHFDQALNPSSSNVPVALDTDPVVRQESQRGQIWLEYKDPILDVASNPTDYTWIPADVELERNDLTGATVVLRPVGVLPNNATVRVIVENTVEDISGESNFANPTYDRVFWEFKTSSSYEQQFNGIVEEFNDSSRIDFSAVFPESQATIGQGFVKAGFAFEGLPTTREYEPTTNEIVLNTDFTQVVPKSGQPFTVSGGIFNFRNVTIPQGVTVFGQGSKPMVWLCSGDFRVSGTLSVRGGNGSRVETLQSANFAKAGGVGVCGGGSGGDGTPSATARDFVGETGEGPLGIPGKGGGGGKICCGIANCYTDPDSYNGSGGGSGGGGGTLATQGDPSYRGTLGTGGTSFQQVTGKGGAGCSGESGTRTATLAGGDAGAAVFVDTRLDNNFWGSAINMQRNLRITGEIAVPMGGGGGGGGGDTVPSNGACSTPTPANDHSGGGGGAGGGVLIVKALGEIEITTTGKIIADGGHGGGGEQAGACGEAGGGGAGSGGMVILMSATRIILHQHGSQAVNRWNYADRDYNFAISADGGVCTTGEFGSTLVTGKYPVDGADMMPGTTYDREPLGGLGGMGIVQLMVPPGPNGTDDETNTILDDNIIVRRPGVTLPLKNLDKIKALAWRGFQDANGAFVADNGVPTNIGKDEGDIRPSPILMPVPFAAQSRVRSKWIDTGSSQRRALVAEDGLPRGVLGNETGPIFSFKGLNNNTAIPGYVDYTPVGSTGVAFLQPLVVDATTITTSQTEGFNYRFNLASPALGQSNRYVQYEAELLNSGNVLLTSFRILSHTANSVLVDGTTDVFPADAKKLRVRAKFFRILTNGSEGLGSVYVPLSGPVVPNANVRIGFAFHKDPQSATGRFPTNEQDFVHDVDGLMQDAAFQQYVTANGLPRYVQWDVIFNLAFSPTSLNPASPRPELHFLRLPFRF